MKLTRQLCIWDTRVQLQLSGGTNLLGDVGLCALWKRIVCALRRHFTGNCFVAGAHLQRNALFMFHQQTCSYSVPARRYRLHNVCNIPGNQYEVTVTLCIIPGVVSSPLIRVLFCCYGGQRTFFLDIRCVALYTLHAHSEMYTGRLLFFLIAAVRMCFTHSPSKVLIKRTATATHYKKVRMQVLLSTRLGLVIRTTSNY